MRNQVSIPILLAILLGCMSLVLSVALIKTTAGVKARQALVELSEQRIAISSISSALRQNLTDLQSTARQYASLGDAKYLRGHQQLLQRFSQRRDLLADPAPAIAAVMPNLHDKHIMRFIGYLTRAHVQEHELKSLRLALDTIVDMGLLQSQLLQAVVPGTASPQVLLSLSQPARENLARQLDAHIASTRGSVEKRLDAEKSSIEQQIATLQLQQLSLLLVLALLILLSFIVVHYYVVRPLRHLVDASAAIGSGQYNTRAKIFGASEVTSLANTINWMADSFQTDLEARERAEHRAQRTEKRLRQINQASPGVLWEMRMSKDGKPQLSFVGGAFESLYSVARVAAMSDFQALVECVHAQDRDQLIKSIFEADQSQSNFTNEHRSLRPDGQYRWIRAYGQLQHEDDNERVWTGFSVDVQELNELRWQLENALAAAESGNRSKAEFLATLSHEIRTPMNAILGMSHLALQTDLNPRQTEYMRRIDSSSRMLLRIINDILDVSKIDAGRMELEHLDFSIEQMLDGVNDVVAVRAQEKNLVLKLDIGAEVPRMLTGDSLRLGQILVNLIGNAIKFTERGYVQLSINCLDDQAQRSRLRFAVEDTGVGISPDVQESLFQAFTQGDSSTTREYGGTGLGLTIARQLVRLMGSDIQLHSEPGRGSTFSFEIDLDVPREQLDAMAANASSLGRLRCLVVDDSRSARKVVVSALDHFGFATAEAENGGQCLKLASQQKFDIIVLDWRMPDIDGLETARRLKLLPQFSARIIMMTSYGREQLIRELEGSINVDGVLLKPVSSPVLLDTIAAAMQPQSKRRPSSQDYVPMRIPDLSTQHILLVEDNDIGRELMEELLEVTRARLTVVRSGEDALAAFSQGGIDLVLLDLHLPNLNGQDTAKAIRQELENESVPILATSADPREQTRQSCLQAGFNDFIVKPVDVSQLYLKLAEWLDAHPSEDTLIAKPAQNLPALEGVNLRAGLSRASYNNELYSKLLKQLCARFEKLPDEMLAWLDQSDWQRLQQQAHSLKGAASNLGAVRIAEESRDIEQNAELFDKQGCRQAILNLGSSLTKLHNELEASGETPATATAETLHPFDESARNQLLQMIRMGDSSARNLLQRYAVGNKATEQLHRLQRHLNAFEFEEAADLLSAMDVTQ